MARTKGSKGKKTLAKEMGMTLEQYEKWLETGKKGMNKIKKKEKEVNESIKKQEKQAKDMYGGYLRNDNKLLEVFDLPTGEIDGVEEESKEDKLLETVDKLGGTINKMITKVAEAVKNNDRLSDQKKLEILGSLQLKTPEEIERESMTLFPFDKLNEQDEQEAPKKKKKDLPECERCHQMILGVPPMRVNLTYLTTMASYHRRVSSDRPLLCWNCLKKFNKLVDDFLLDDESGIPEKFKIN